MKAKRSKSVRYCRPESGRRILVAFGRSPPFWVLSVSEVLHLDERKESYNVGVIFDAVWVNVVLRWDVSIRPSDTAHRISGCSL